MAPLCSWWNVFKSFRSQLVDQVVGGCVDFLCSCQAVSKTASTTGYLGMKSCTVRDSQIMASHPIAQPCMAATSHAPCSSSRRGTMAEAVAAWMVSMAASERQLSSSTSTNFPRLRMLMTVEDYKFFSLFVDQEKPEFPTRWSVQVKDLLSFNTILLDVWEQSRQKASGWPKR